MKGHDLYEGKWHFSSHGPELPCSAKLSVQALLNEAGLTQHHCGARSHGHRGHAELCPTNTEHHKSQSLLKS